MDAKFIIAFLFAAIVAVYCKPVEDVSKEVKDDDSIVLTHDEYVQLTKTMDSLSKSVTKFKDDLKKKEAAEAAKKDAQEDFHSLEESLKKAVAADNAKRDAKAPKSSFFNADADFMDYDFDEYDEQMEKRSKVKPVEKKKIVKPPPKDVTESESPAKPGDVAVSGPHLDQPADVEIVKPEVLDPAHEIANDEEDNDSSQSDEEKVKHVAQELKTLLKDVAAEYKTMKAKFEDIKNDAPMDDVTKDKFRGVYADIKKVIDQMKQIKDEFSSKDVSDAVDNVEDAIPAEEQRADELKDILGDLKDQVNDIKLDIKELSDEAHRMEDESNAKKSAQIETKKEVKDQDEMDEEKTQLEALQEELQGVRADVKAIKEDLKMANDAPSKKEIMQNENDRLEDLLSEVQLIKEEVKDMKEHKDEKAIPA